MRRRTFLTGLAATSSLGVLGVRRPKTSLAARRVRLINQMPMQYELVDLWPHLDSVIENGEEWHGMVRGIANDGTCVGDEALDGVLRAVAWDLSGAMSLLDMREDPMVSSMATLANSSGIVIGTSRTTGAVTDVAMAAWTTVLWRNGLEVTSGLPDGFSDASTVVTSINDRDVFAGEVASTPSRWVAGTLEQIPAQPGFVWGGARAIAANGSVGGTLWASLDFLGQPAPFVWAADGTVTVYESPMGFIPGESNRFRVFSLSESGDLAASCTQGGAQPDYLLRYAGGVQSYIPDITGEGAYLVAANEGGALLGYSIVNGAYIPSIWIDDQPRMIADLIVPGPDRLLTDVMDINDDGLIVGMAQDSMGAPYSVVLIPV